MVSTIVRCNPFRIDSIGPGRLALRVAASAVRRKIAERGLHFGVDLQIGGRKHVRQLIKTIGAENRRCDRGFANAQAGDNVAGGAPIRAAVSPSFLMISNSRRCR